MSSEGDRVRVGRESVTSPVCNKWLWFLLVNIPHPFLPSFAYYITVFFFIVFFFLIFSVCCDIMPQHYILLKTLPCIILDLN